jgi:hypothetical protein
MVRYRFNPDPPILYLFLRDGPAGQKIGRGAMFSTMSFGGKNMEKRKRKRGKSEEKKEKRQKRKRKLNM